MSAPSSMRRDSSKGPAPPHEVSGERESVRTGYPRRARRRAFESVFVAEEGCRPGCRLLGVRHRDGARHGFVARPVRRHSVPDPARAGDAVSLEEPDDVTAGECHPEVARAARHQSDRRFDDVHVGEVPAYQFAGPVTARRRHDDLEGLVEVLFDQGGDNSQDRVFVAVREDDCAQDRVVSRSGFALPGRVGA